MVKIELKQEEEKEIVVEVLLDSSVTVLVISKKFVRKNKFRKMKLERPIYMENIDIILNYIGPIVNIVEVELFFKRYKERISIDVIGGQSWSVILEMLQLTCYNPEINWKIEKIQMMRCLDECGKKWRIKQIKPGW